MDVYRVGCFVDFLYKVGLAPSITANDCGFGTDGVPGADGGLVSCIESLLLFWFL